MAKLAIFGGKPIRNSYLSYGRQTINESDIEVVVEVLKGDFLTTGPAVREFENSVATYVGAKYAVAVSNGTAALHMACFAAGISEGDEVLVPPLTFAASANAVLYCGGKPVFVDVDPLTYNIDISKIEEMITPKTKAIIPVDFTGQSVDMDAIMEIAKRHKLMVIEDAAQAPGAKYQNKLVGTFGDCGIFSLTENKNITSGEGGVLITDDEEIAEIARLIRNHGEAVIAGQKKRTYKSLILGWNYRMTEVDAAIGIEQFKKLDYFTEERNKLANYLTKNLQKS